ncbi:MAG: signal peptidase II [Patescibacteria group bacterium]|nr:signal peptidase II [Patescibacteria group bacterium]
MKYLKMVGSKLNEVMILSGWLLALDRLLKFLALKGVLKISKNQNLFFFNVNKRWLIISNVLIISILLLQLIKVRRNKSRLMLCGYLLIILGGLSNLFDRVVYGYVIDMINLFSLSVFNLADAMIMTGCVLILFSSIFYNSTGE